MKESNNNWALKCLSSIVTVSFLSVMPLQAQDLEIQSNTTGYIDCSHGVKIVTQKVRQMSREQMDGKPYSFSSSTLTAQALYALGANGKPETLLWVRIPHAWYNGGAVTSARWENRYCEYTILPGTKRIAKGAFKNCVNIVQLNIPSSIRYIPEDCFDGLPYTIIDIKDDTQTSINAREASENEIEEVGRYNLQGMKVDKDMHGVQIVQYSNGSARKVLNNNQR